MRQHLKLLGQRYHRKAKLVRLAVAKRFPEQVLRYIQLFGKARIDGLFEVLNARGQHIEPQVRKIEMHQQALGERNQIDLERDENLRVLGIAGSRETRGPLADRRVVKEIVGRENEEHPIGLEAG